MQKGLLFWELGRAAFIYCKVAVYMYKSNRKSRLFSHRPPGAREGKYTPSIHFTPKAHQHHTVLSTGASDLEAEQHGLASGGKAEGRRLPKAPACGLRHVIQYVTFLKA